MAKKSAASKGYRRQSVKKPYLSKRDIAIVRVVAAAPGPPSVLLTIRMYGGALKDLLRCAGAAATWGFEFRTSFSRGNVCFVLAVTFRARLFLFPVPCSLFPVPSSPR